MRISEAKYEGGVLMLTAPPESEIYRFIYGFKAGDYEIKPRKKKRSLDANAYLWALCTEIGEKLRLPKEDVYRRAIKEAGISTILNMRIEAREAFDRAWGAHGLGWFTETLDEGEKVAVIAVYTGSSVYDTAQMARLLDNVIEDAKAIGIETLSERELSLLKEGWEPRTA